MGRVAARLADLSIVTTDDAYAEDPSRIAREVAVGADDVLEPAYVSELMRALARTLPRSSEHLIRDRVKFRVGSIVYVAFSRDETTMGFGYPKEERDALIAGEPDLFFLPAASDLRFHWVCCHLARLDHGYMTELVTDAWRMVVPKFLARQRLGN